MLLQLPDNINTEVIIFIWISLVNSNFYSIFLYLQTDSPLSSLSDTDLSRDLYDSHTTYSNVEEQEEVINDDPQQSLKDKLVSWQIENHIPHLHCDRLLKILKPYHPELPLTTKNLVQTSRKKVQLSNVPPGRYKHFGIEAGVIKTLRLTHEDVQLNPLKLYVGIDDVKLNRSSSSQFTSIVGFILSLPDSTSFEIGVFHAYSKASSFNVLLGEFIAEANRLYNTGFDFDGRQVRIIIGALICDAPARATVLCVKGHSSPKQGCTKCMGAGVFAGQPRTRVSEKNNV